MKIIIVLKNKIVRCNRFSSVCLAYFLFQMEYIYMALGAREGSILIKCIKRIQDK